MKWIPINNEHPPFNQKVIVFTATNRIIMSTLRLDPNYPEDIMWHDDDGYTVRLDQSTHWMPLPNPPNK